MRKLAVVLKFFRIPLAWTAIADCCAGATIALSVAPQRDWSLLVPLAVISAAVYSFGMAMNDLVDVEADRLAGRDRPLARHELSTRGGTLLASFVLGMALVGTAFLNSAAVLMTGLLIGLVAVYNLAAKHRTLTAMLVMAACRVSNVLVGWSAVTGDWRVNFWPADGDVNYTSLAALRALLVAVAMMTALASLISGLEKRHGMTTILGARASAIVLACLLSLPLADCLAVFMAWDRAPWAMIWLATSPLVVATSLIVRKMAGATSSDATEIT